MGHDLLTAKQDGFAQDIANRKYDYIWEAYKANYNCDGMAQNTLYQESCRLLKNPKVSARIREIEKKIRKKEELTLDKIIRRLAKRNEVDVRDLFEDDGTIKPISKLTADQAVFVTGIKVSEIWGRGDESGIQVGRIVDIKIESFKDIMDMLIRHHGGYAKDKEQTSSDLEHIKEIIKAAKR